MDDLNAVFYIDWKSVIIALFTLALAILFVVEVFKKIQKLFGIEFTWQRKRREDHELLVATTELVKKTAENLDKLQSRHTKDEEEFRINLNNYIEESRKDRKALHDEMSKFNTNRVNDRQVSVEREKRLNDKIDEGNKHRDEIIDSISDSLHKLTDMFVDKNVEDMRWEILNFCSALTSGRKYNKESFNHVINVHEKYEKILEENNMENGQVTASMEVIMDVYKEKLKNGF